MSKIGVETAQHVQLNYKPAGVVERILAYILDGIVLGAYFIAIMMLGDSGSEPVDTTVGDEYLWLGMLLIFLPVWLYHLVLEVLWNGYTVGKWLVGIRVVKLDGTRPGITNYLLRWFIRLFEVTMTSGGLALVTILINGKGQRLGDIAAKTCVIKVGRSTKLSDTVLDNFTEDYEARFPQVMELNDEDVTVINDLLKSRDKYEYATWVKMVNKTKKIIEQKMGVSDHGLGSVRFLHQVKKDYNALHGVLE
jgi:uncharacterized RDD family membrane protein YckC